MEVLAALSAWLRFCRAQQNRGVSKSNECEAYSVFLAVKGEMLYPSSEPMRSRARKFSRSFEPPKFAVTSLLIGTFETEAEAVKAFEEAYLALPTERKLNPQQRLPTMLVSRRSCGRHRLVRCAYSKPGPCEICRARDIALFKAETKRFIWKGQNYLEKTCRDTVFLAENIVFQMVAPDFPREFNPLLLPANSTLHRLFELLHSSSTAVPTQSFFGDRQTLRETDLTLEASGGMSRIPPLSAINRKIPPPIKMSAAFDPFPLPQRTYDASDFLSLDRYLPNSIDKRLLRAQHFVFIYCNFAEGNSALHEHRVHGEEKTEHLKMPHGRGVIASYVYKGATQSATQFRQDRTEVRDSSRGAGVSEAAHRQGDEWSSMVNRGRAVRSFEFRQKIKHMTRELLHEKKTIRTTLRNLANTNILELNPDFANDTITRARLIRGGFVDYDILKVENFLNARDALIAAIITFQSLWRSYSARNRSKIVLFELKIRREAFVDRIVSASRVALKSVANITAMALINQVKYQTTPIFRWGINLSGARVILLMCVSFNHRSNKETWKIKAYDPLSSQKIVLDIELDHGLEILRYLCQISANIEKECATSRLIGDSYEKLSALFRNNTSTKYDPYDVLVARIEAAKQSSALPLIPKSITPNLLRRIISDGRWLLFSEKFIAKRNFDRALKKNQYLEAIAMKAQAELTDAEESLLSYRTTHLEAAHMGLEDSASELLRLGDSFVRAQAKLAVVMAYSKSQLEAFEAFCDRRLADDAPSWREMERASLWKDLNRSRKIQKQCEECVSTMRQQRLAVEACEAQHTSNAQRRDGLLLFAQASRLHHEAYQSVVARAKLLSQETRDAALEASNLLCSSLSLHRNLDRRELKALDLQFVHVRDPITRCDWQFRSLLPLISHTSLDPLCLKDLNLSIWWDLVTGHWIISGPDSVVEFEESCFYDDLFISRPVNLDRFQRRCEVFLPHQIVYDIVVRHKDWPMNLQRGYLEDDAEARLMLRNSCQRLFAPLIGAQGKDDNLFASSFTLRASQCFLDQSTIARRIASSLRMRPSTERITIGGYHILLRAKMLENVMGVECRWFADVMARIAPVNEVFRIVYPILGNPSIVKVVFDGLRFIISTLGDLKEHILHVPLNEALLHSLQSPFLAHSFVSELITNAFSRDTIIGLLDMVDSDLTDGYQRRWWRGKFLHEPLHLVFLQSSELRYRGPIHRTQRAFANMNFDVGFYVSLKGDLRIVLESPAAQIGLGMDYTDKRMVIDLTEDKLRSFLDNYLEETLRNEIYAGPLPWKWNGKIYELILDYIEVVRVPRDVGSLIRERGSLCALTLRRRSFKDWTSNRLPKQILDIDAIDRNLLEYGLILKGKQVERTSLIAVLSSSRHDEGLDVLNAIDVDDGIIPTGDVGNRRFRKIRLLLNRTQKTLSVFTTIGVSDEEIMSCQERFAMREEEVLSQELRRLPVSRDEASETDSSDAASDHSLMYRSPMMACIVFPTNDREEPRLIQWNLHTYMLEINAILDSQNCGLCRSMNSQTIDFFLQSSGQRRENKRHDDFLRSLSATTADVVYPIRGTVVSLLRRPGTVEHFESWLRLDRQRDAESEKAQWRTIIAYNEGYRGHVLEMVEVFEPSMLRLFGCDKLETKRAARASIHQCQRLVSNFISAIFENQMLVFAIDPDEAIPSSDLYECYLPFLVNVDITSTHIDELLMNKNYYSGQILFSLYINHLGGCDLPLSFCCFPGCCTIRRSAKGCGEPDRYRAMVHCIKEFLCSESCLYYMRRISGLPSPSENVKSKGSAQDGINSAPAFIETKRLAVSLRSDHRMKEGTVEPSKRTLDSTRFPPNSDSIAHTPSWGFPKTGQECHVDTVPESLIRRMRGDCHSAVSSGVGPHVVSGTLEFKTCSGAPDSITYAEPYIWLISRLRLREGRCGSCYDFDRRLAFCDGSNEGHWATEVLYGVFGAGDAENFERFVATKSLSRLSPGISITVRRLEDYITGSFSFGVGHDLDCLAQILGLPSTYISSSMPMVAEAVASKFAGFLKIVPVGNNCVRLQLRTPSQSSGDNIRKSTFDRRKHLPSQAKVPSKAVENLLQLNL